MKGNYIVMCPHSTTLHKLHTCTIISVITIIGPIGKKSIPSPSHQNMENECKFRMQSNTIIALSHSLQS